jgi:DNA-directed RNA polymerase specialized sigma24 family protein
MTNDVFTALLVRAIDGDSEAMSQILLEYDPLFQRLARIDGRLDGRLDEDCYQYIRLRAFEMTRRFRLAQEKNF